MTQWPAGRDCKRSFHFPFCPGQDADDVPDKCLFNQSLKTPTTCPGILSHSIYSSVQQCHYFLLYPLQTRLSISFLSWSLNEYPHPFRKTWTISRHCTFLKIFPVAVALTTKWPGILLPNYCPLNLYLCLGTTDSHSLALLLLRADIRSIRAFPSSSGRVWHHFYQKLCFRNKIFTSSKEPVLPMTPKLQQSQEATNSKCCGH